MYKKIAQAIVIISTLCSSHKAMSDQQPAGTHDPLGPLNRAMYTFNDGLDHLILKPVAQVYLDVAPTPIVHGVRNFYDNLENVPTIGNDILQIDFHQAVTDTSRLLINTTLGIAGFFDVAKLAGVPQNSEDMGLTLAHWGWTSSTYLVLPFFGPSTVRDALGKPIDGEMSIYAYIKNVNFRNELYAMGVVNIRASLLQLQGIIAEAALDPYVFQRNAYLQRRDYLIERNDEMQDIHTRAPHKMTSRLSNISGEIPPVPAKQVASY